MDKTLQDMLNAALAKMSLGELLLDGYVVLAVVRCIICDIARFLGGGGDDQ